MHFILANLDNQAKIPAMLSLCSNFERQQVRHFTQNSTPNFFIQTKDEIENCKAKIAAQVQEGLKQNLKRMRFTMARLASLEPNAPTAKKIYKNKSDLMQNLQFFRAVGFILGSVGKSSQAMGVVNELYLKLITRWMFKLIKLDILLNGFHPHFLNEDKVANSSRIYF